MLSLPATLTHAVIANDQQWVLDAKAANWQVHAGQLKQFDSSALALLMMLVRAPKAQGQTLTVSHAPSALAKLAHLYGISELIFI